LLLHAAARLAWVGREPSYAPRRKHCIAAGWIVRVAMAKCAPLRAAAVDADDASVVRKDVGLHGVTSPMLHAALAR
jgi:hypothetical protein